MSLQQNIKHINRRKVKFLTVNVMGLVGLVIATVAVIYSHDQAALLTQLGSELAQTPVGSIVSAIKTLF